VLGPFPFHGGEGTLGEQVEAGGSTIRPEVPAEVGISTIVPQEPRGASPSAQEQGAISKWPHSDEVEQRSMGSPPKDIYCLTALR